MRIHGEIGHMRNGSTERMPNFDTSLTIDH